MTQDEYTKQRRIAEVKFAFRENGVTVRTEQDEAGWRRDTYVFLDGSDHKEGWYKDEYDVSGKLLKRSFLFEGGECRDAYFEDGELKKLIKHFGNGKKKVIYLNKTKEKDRVVTFFDEDGLIEGRMVWNVDNRLILQQKFFRDRGDGIVEERVFFNSKGLPDHGDVFNKNGEKLYTEFPRNEKGETKKCVYHNGKSHIEVYNSCNKFLYEEHSLDNGEYHSMRVYRDGDVIKGKEFLDRNGVVREQKLYCDGVPVCTEFLDTEGVVVRTVGYDALGRIETVKQLDDENLEYRDAETVYLTDRNLENGSSGEKPVAV